MTRKILALLAFNVYSLFLISAFKMNTAYLFDTSLVNKMRLKGIGIKPSELGWGGHYIWCLFSYVVVTGLVAMLTGAISKTNGKKIAALANIPNILIWLSMIYLFGFANVEENGKARIIISFIIAIPLTSYVAYVFGGIGEKLQHNKFREDTVLGIRGYHWVWAILPIYWYMLSIVFLTTKCIAFQFSLWADNSIFSALISWLLLIPVVAWAYPLLLAYRVLTGDILSSHGTVVRGFANLGILIVGMLVATGVQYVDFWILGKILR